MVLVLVQVLFNCFFFLFFFYYQVSEQLVLIGAE